MPGTLKNDQFGSASVEDALDALACCEPTIDVVGVTDYFTTASYRRANNAWQNGAGTSIKLLFPNVELRLSIPTAKGSAVNAHLLCAPDEVDELEQFLSLLEFSYAGHPYRCTPDDLVRLGRAWKKDTKLDDGAALRAGAEQFKVEFADLRERYTQSNWARRHCLVAIAVGQHDGTSGVRTDDDAFAALRTEMERFAHVIFSGSPKQIEFWLGRGVLDAQHLTREYSGLKPCVHGCDAHRFDQLGAPEYDRFTWLKGDASFDTLRLACLAPDSRCHVGSAPPTSGAEHGRISALAVSPAGWFEPGSIPINPGLVAVIGARGSGKTALVDLVVAGAGARDPFDNDSSFVRRVGSLLNPVSATIDWTHGDTTECRFSKPPEDPAGRSVRYLSQQFVEQLCSSRGVSDELVAEIERVVFNACPVEERQGSTTFTELLDVRLTDARVRKRAELEAVRRLGELIINERMLKEALPQKRADLEAQAKALERIDEQIKEMLRETTQGDADRLALVTATLEARQDQVQRADRQVTELRALRSAVASLLGSKFPQTLIDLRGEHAATGLTDDEWAWFEPTFKGDVDEIITTAVDRATHARDQVSGRSDENTEMINLDALDANELGQRTVVELSRDRKRLQDLVGLDAARAKKLDALNKQSSGARSRVAKLKSEVETAEKAEVRAQQYMEERLQHYAAYFDSLLEEERVLGDLYSPLDAILADAPGIEKLRFSVQRRVDVDAWSGRGEELLDLRKGDALRGVGAIAAIAEAELAEAWREGNGDSAAAAIKRFSEDHSKDFRVQSVVDRRDRSAYRAWERALAGWLYSGDHVTLTYSIEFGGLNIERLSPGTRGIVLLLLYLAVDQAETDPLIIDQPEENLDPESVQSELVQLFRDASARRQIIMVTHNANLVINTDVDQVIYARCEQVEEGKLPQLRYLSGGLEDTDIRATVCEVLEGGAEAFRERARRLRLELDL